MRRIFFLPFLLCLVLSFLAGGLVVYWGLGSQRGLDASAASETSPTKLPKQSVQATTKPPLVIRPALKLASTPPQGLTIDPQDAPQILDALRGNFMDAPSLLTMPLDPQNLAPMLQRFGPKIGLSDRPIPLAAELPALQAELITPEIGYWRVGHFQPKAVQKLVRAYNQWTAHAPLKGMIIDLRYFQAINDYRGAADFVGLFSAPRTPLFTLQGLQSSQEVFQSMRQPLVWRKNNPLIVLIHGQTAGAGEVTAQVLAQVSHAILLGEPTRGEAALYHQTALRSGKFFRQAAAEAVTASGEKMLGHPVTPDIALPVDAVQENLAIQEGYTKGVESVIAELKLPMRPNEASLVHEEDVELEDALEARDASPLTQTTSIHDVALQSAVDILRAVALVHQPVASSAIQTAHR